jgi:DNA-binding transcriptional ArsR family regulator
MNADSNPATRPLPDDQVALAVEVFRMLADGTRIQILWALVGGEKAVNDLAEVIGKPGPSVSQHLAKLRMARLVRTRREGNQIFCELENDHVKWLIVDGIYNAEHAGSGIPAHHARNSVSTIHQDRVRDTAAGAPWPARTITMRRPAASALFAG